MKISRILAHQGEEKDPHTHQDDQNKRANASVGIEKSRPLCPASGTIKNGATAMENSMEVPPKIKKQNYMI